jgi:hypothetical protein
MPTRLIYGLSYLRPFSKTSAYTLTAAGTPNVKMGTYFQTANSALTILNFAGGEMGKVIYLVSKSGGATTIQNSAGGINVFSSVATLSAGILKYSSTSNYLMANNEILAFMNIGSGWSQIGPNLRID